MNTRGRHLLVEYWGCEADVLDDVGAVEALMKRAAEAAGATLVESVFHRFCPQGVSGVVVVEESHLSIHTWPEKGYAAVDFYTCGDCEPERAHEELRRVLKPRRAEKIRVRRGLGPLGPSMNMVEHVVERDGEAGEDVSTSTPSVQGESSDAGADPFRPWRPALGFSATCGAA